MGLPETEEASGDDAPPTEAERGTLGLVTLTVAGLGDYATPVASRVDEILNRAHPAEPNVLALQEMVVSMIEQLRIRLPDLTRCRLRGAS